MIICSDNDGVVTETVNTNQQLKVAVPVNAILYGDGQELVSAAQISTIETSSHQSTEIATSYQLTEIETQSHQSTEIATTSHQSAEEFKTQAPDVTVIVREAKAEDDDEAWLESDGGNAKGSGKNDSQSPGEKADCDNSGIPKVDLMSEDVNDLEEGCGKEGDVGHHHHQLSQVSRRSKRKAAMCPRRRGCRAGCCEDGRKHGESSETETGAERLPNTIEEHDRPSSSQSPKRMKNDDAILPCHVTPIVNKTKLQDSDAVSPKKTVDQKKTLSDQLLSVNIKKEAKSDNGKTATDLLSELQSDLQSDVPAGTQPERSSDISNDTQDKDPSGKSAETPDDDAPVAESADDETSNMPAAESDDTGSINSRFECVCGTRFTHKKSLIRHFRRKGARADGEEEEGSQHFSRYPIAIYANTKAPDRKPKQTSFPCPHCSKVLQTKAGIDYHIMGHTGDKPETCSLCGKSFKSKQILDQHFVIHTKGDLPFRCDQCGRTYVTNTRLRAHQKIHGEKQYKCQLCHHAFVMRKDLNKHMRVHTGVKPFQCDYCEVQFHFSQDRKRHHLTNHGDKAEFRCHLCPKYFFKEDELEKHVKIHSIEDSDFSCGICGQNFSSYTTMRNHRMTHSSDFNPFQCRYESCNLIFKCSNDRYLHERKNHDMNLFKCQYCSLSFKKQNSYEEHHKKHEDASYVCRVNEECRERFQQPHMRLRHEKSHGQDPSSVKAKGKQKKRLVTSEIEEVDMDAIPETIYQCGVCWKTYKNYPSLRDHVRDHGEDMPYGCRISGCPSRFKRVYHRRKHEQTHSTSEIINSVIESRLNPNDEEIIGISEEEEIIVETEEEAEEVMFVKQEIIHQQQGVMMEPDLSDTVAATEVVEATEIMVGDEQGEETQIAVEFVMH